MLIDCDWLHFFQHSYNIICTCIHKKERLNWLSGHFMAIWMTANFCMIYCSLLVPFRIVQASLYYGKNGFMCEWRWQWKMHRTWISLQLFRNSTCEMKIWYLLTILQLHTQKEHLWNKLFTPLPFPFIPESEWQYLIVWNLIF